MKKRIYLANPCGFSQLQKNCILPLIVEALESLGAEVWEPFAKTGQIDISEKGGVYRIGQIALEDAKQCDAIFAVVNGNPPDEGVMIELGVAIALGKKIFLFRDDFRINTDSSTYPLNLMLFAGMPENGWKDFYYSSLDEISSEKKALARWLRNDLP